MKKVFEGIEKRNLDEKQKNLALVQKPVGYDFCLEGFENEVDSRFGGKLPWERYERMVFRRTKKEKKVTQAELKLDPDLLERLRNEASKMRKWVKVKKLRDQIFFIWKNNELAMLKFDIPLCRNMDRAAEIVEIKTGGLVVWCKKDELVVYRGSNCPSASNRYSRSQLVEPIKSSQSTIFDEESTVAVTGSLFEREADRLLEGLGPRFIDWWYHKPLPVDADLLAESVPGFKPPFRLCPPGSIKYRQDKLTDNELAHLRNLARPLPTHFVVGRNRKLQGLAVAILKLWGKCHIAKIAVKLGVPNTDNEQMANELKVLTGGDLLLRNKYYIVLYRGKDFLPCDVANLVAERETELYTFQIEEESAQRSSIQYETDESSSAATGTLLEFKEIVRESVEIGNREAEIEKQKLEIELKNKEHKLFILKKKIKRTGRELAKLNSWWIPSENDDDRELITYEEKESFRKIALKMDNCLVLGWPMLHSLSTPNTYINYPKTPSFRRVNFSPARIRASASLPEAPNGNQVEYTPWLIVGLGNPGNKYHGTRHNVGFEMVDRISQEEGIVMNTIQSKALVGIGCIGEIPVLLAKPQAYMNFSGESVGPLAAYYQVPLRHILVIYDEMSLANGVLKLHPKGGFGYHNGLKSVMEHLDKRRDFPRFCIGVGNPPGTMDMKAFLLQKFSTAERKQMDEALDEGPEAVRSLLFGGFKSSKVTRFNLSQKYKYHKV